MFRTLRPTRIIKETTKGKTVKIQAIEVSEVRRALDNAKYREDRKK